MKTKKHTKLSNVNSIKDSVLREIADSELQPTARHVFWLQSWVLYAVLAVVSLLGGVAASVVIFVLGNQYYSLYELWFDGWSAFVLQVVPLAWLCVFCVTLFYVSWQVRQIGRGYRFPVWLIAILILTFSLVFGLIIEKVGYAFLLDNWLGEQSDIYLSQHDREQRLWQQPELGRLMGLVTAISTSTSKMNVEDMSGVVWAVSLSELSPRAIDLLHVDSKIRLLGSTTDMHARLFSACVVLPWMLNERRTGRELRAVRDRFRGEVEGVLGRGETATVRVCRTVPHIRQMSYQQHMMTQQTR